MTTLAWDGSPYISYAYAYPHKTAYRPLTPPVPLTRAWEAEPRDALFLYLHIPFCEMRCGFCNLFTPPNPPEEMEEAYLTALERQVRQVDSALGERRFARMAVGGGTPTYLSTGGLVRLLTLAERLGANLSEIPVSVETSPQTAVGERLTVLAEAGVDRISIGIQSFLEEETRLVGRPQTRGEVEKALTAIRAARFPTLNMDLIYGLPGQTASRWAESLHAALAWKPEEVYLYPLYVRPLTGLGRSRREWDDQRLTLYRQARETLLAAGYVQVSMRMFRASHAPEETAADGPVYCTQESAMVGVGCGARSYTRSLQYSSEYAVGRVGVRSILDDYLQRPEADFAFADYGFRLSPDEQRRRYLIYTLLTAEGTDLNRYRAYFHSELVDDLPELEELVETGLAVRSEQRFRLTPAGLERSDAIGPWLYSQSVQALMETFNLK